MNNKMLLNRTINRIVVILIFLFSLNSLIFAQEVIESIKYNPVLVKASHSNIIAKRTKIDTFNITNLSPFFDDFSQWLVELMVNFGDSYTIFKKFVDLSQF